VRLLTSGEDGRGWPESERSSAGGWPWWPARTSRSCGVPVNLRRRGWPAGVQLVEDVLPAASGGPGWSSRRRTGRRRSGSALQQAAAARDCRAGRGRRLRSCGSSRRRSYIGTRAQASVARTPRPRTGSGAAWPCHGGLQRRARMGFHGLEAGLERTGLASRGLRPAKEMKGHGQTSEDGLGPTRKKGFLIFNANTFPRNPRKMF
jgi:hypothetical protein